MKDLNIIDFTDFYFNGKYLSDFGGMVGDNNGGKLNYSLLPSREYIIDRPFNYDGEIVFDVHVNPRSWEVPIFFYDINDNNIRSISKWLDTDEAQPFYFKNDTVRINARIDSDAFYFDTYSGIEGLTSLKFIAHDPYFYDIDKTVVNMSLATDPWFYNRGNIGSPFKITVNGSGLIGIGVVDAYGNHQECRISDVSGGVILDTKTMSVTDLSGNNMFNNFMGEYIQIPPGDFKIQIAGIETATLEYNGRYI
jgi:phage-related protein